MNIDDMVKKAALCASVSSLLDEQCDSPIVTIDVLSTVMAAFICKYAADGRLAEATEECQRGLAIDVLSVRETMEKISNL